MKVVAGKVVCWEDWREKKGGRPKKRRGRRNNKSNKMAGRHGRDVRSRKIGGLYRRTGERRKAADT